MSYIYLVLAVVFSAALSIFNMMFKKANQKCTNIADFYNVIVSISAMVSWLFVFLSQAEGDPFVIVYSIMYGICYDVALIGLYKALEEGSAALTSFVKQLSFIAVSVWGFIFWASPFTLTVGIGMLLIIAALYLCFRPSSHEENKTISKKWLLYAFFLLGGNAGCSIIQKYQQAHFDGKYGSMLMFVSMIFASGICAVMYFKNGRTDVRKISRVSLVYPLLSGVCSMGVNMMIIFLLTSTLSASVVFPVIAVGGMILTTLFSVFVYKEKLTPIQWVGLLIGAVAIAFLNM